MEPSPLTSKTCIPCKGGIPPLKGADLISLHAQLKHEWKIVSEHHLEKEYRFTNFAEALEFTNKVGALAENEGHHPDILLSFGKVKLMIWTHKIDGLTENDFILAAKCDEIL
jgi:4a-hydroxytetrahydrobiopterin dehydratase